MTKPQLVKVEALFYVLQQVTKRDCAYFDTAPLTKSGESGRLRLAAKPGRLRRCVYTDNML